MTKLAGVISTEGAGSRNREDNRSGAWNDCSGIFDTTASGSVYPDPVRKYLFSSGRGLNSPCTNVGLSVYPCPSDGSVTVVFDLLSGGPLELAVFDLSGGMVERITWGDLDEGHHRLSCDCRAAGVPAAKGVYFVRRVTGGDGLTRMLVIL